MAESGGKRQIAVDCGSFVVGLWLLSRWKQVDVYKVSRGCPVTILVEGLAETLLARGAVLVFLLPSSLVSLKIL